jgi:sugar phosphate isomerase/epimerase
MIGGYKMSKAKIACAVWPWGLETKEQMIQALRDVSEIGYTAFESVKAAINVFNGDASEFKNVVEEYGVKPVSFYFHLLGDDKEDIDDLQRKMDFLAKLDVKRISLQANHIAGRKPTEEELVKVLKTIEKIGVIAKDYEVVPCVHPHHNTMIMYAAKATENKDVIK